MRPGSNTTIYFTLRKIYIDRQGYSDKGRRYWGIGGGVPLFEYEAQGTEEDFTGHVRAADKKDAKRKILIDFPLAKFVR